MKKFGVMTITSANGISCPPYSFISLSSYSTDQNGNILLSLDMRTNTEVDIEVDKLIEQLEKIRVKAKKELQKAYKRSTT